MKLTATKILVLCALIAITQETRLKTKKLNLKSLCIHRGSVSFQLEQIAIQHFEKEDITIQGRLKQGDFGTVYAVENNPNIAVKVIEFNEYYDYQLSINEITTYEQIQNFLFSLPLCRLDELKDDGKLKGMALILPRAKENLCYQLFDEYENATKFSLKKKIEKLFSSEVISEEKSYEIFEPKLKQFVQMAIGLQEFHQTGYVHTNIRPENYLIMKGEKNLDRIVLTGFRLAVEATNAFTNYLQEGDGFIPMDFDREEKEIYLSQKIDTFALGVTYLNMTVIQFFRCFNTNGNCKVKNFFSKFIKLSNHQLESYNEFREYLEKKEANGTRYVSSIQKAVENLVFDKLLTNFESRLTSQELVTELKKIVPKNIFREIKIEFKRSPISCHGIEQGVSFNDIPEEFSDTHQRRIKKPKKFPKQVFEDLKRDLESDEDSDYSD